MSFSANKPLPRTTLELVCGALAEVIQQRHVTSGPPLNRLAELICLRKRWSLLPPSSFLPRWKTSWRNFATVAGSYEMATQLAGMVGIGIEDSTIRALVQRLAVPLSRFTPRDGGGLALR